MQSRANEVLILQGMNKPGGCPLRRMKPRGPIKGCEDTCQAFEVCVEHTLNERSFEEYRRKELWRLDNLGRESLNPVEAS